MPHAFQGTFVRRHPLWTTFALFCALLVLGLALVILNPQWLRGSLQRVLSANFHRDLTIGEVHLGWRGGPTLELNDLVLANLPGGSEPQMARIKSLNMTLAPLELLRGRVVVPRVAVDEADVLLERVDGHQNWILGDDQPAKPDKEKTNRLRLGSVSLLHGRVRYLDRAMPMAVTVQVRPLDQQSAALARGIDTAPATNNRYALGFDISGKYKGNPFSGNAQSGGAVSLQDSGVPFPLRLALVAGETRLQMEGTLANALQLSGIDMRMQIAGSTLANIYPLLLLPLPASPPYSLHGRLRRDGNHFAIQELGGRIGSTDLQGEGSYDLRSPRPLLRVQLRSELMNIADLGPLIGVETQSRTSKPVKQTELATREQAARTDPPKRGERVLPAGHFDPERLRLIDAEVRLQGQRVKGVATVPLENFVATLRLQDAVLELNPLELDAAGGKFVARARLDARKGDTLLSRVETRVQHLHIDQLVPKKASIAKGAGLMNLSATLTGSGNSIADAAAHADGRIAATLFEGQVSSLLDAASGLAIGRVLALLATGDREIKLNCGATVFDVQDGQGHSSLFVLDTAKTQVLGSGQFDLAHERFALHVAPKPKNPGFLSLRTPVDLNGTFSHAEVSLEKKPLLARAGAAIALAAVAPPAALFALVETGPGEDTPCASVLQTAGDKSRNKPAVGDAR